MRRALAAVAFAGLLAGCAVGPNYHRPAAPPTMTGAFVDPAAAAPSLTARAAVPDTWWRLFDDPALDRLVTDALAHNTDVRVAVANVAQARGFLSEARAGRLPSTALSGGVQRRRLGAASAGFGTTTLSGGAGLGGGGTTTGTTTGTGTPASTTGTPSHYDFTLYTAGLDAQYEVDLFGRVSRSIEAARGDTEAALADLDAARVAVAAETARSYASACGYAQQEAVARETAALQDRTLDLTQRLFDAGRGTRRDIDQARVLSENARAQAPFFAAERRASLYALAALTGHPPAEMDADAARCTSPPNVTTPLPIGDGAALLARRPDVRAAERRLAAETARIGIATAALFPSITLGGSVNLAATRAGDLTKGSAFSFAVGPLISWNFPNIAVARARIRQARASSAAALARFDGAVLTALRESEQALTRYAGLAETLEARTRAADAAEDAARLSRTRFDAGRDSFLQLLDSERDRAAARASLAQSRADIAAAQIAVFNALGGGWEVSPSSLATTTR